MYNLFIIIEQSCNGYKIEILNFISFISVLTGVFVIITKNPIISILFLICLFLSIACYLILLGISYIGLSYLLVYIGAVSILFLFILMLINIRISELQSETSNSLALALILGACFYYIVQDIIPQGLFSNNVFFNTIDLNYENLFFVTSNS
jgi:NADH-ubiquinone oxidoreductase chain 6